MSDMSNDEIIANTENIESVVTTFASAIGDYIDRMNGNVDRLMSAVSALQAGWGAADYQSFLGVMNEKCATVHAEMDKAGSLKQYLEEAALEMREFLSKLKKASDS